MDDRPEGDLRNLPCKVLRGEGKGPARARNLGVAHATGTYLLFLDDDAAVDPLYLGRILREIEARPQHAVSGIQMAGGRRNSFSLAAEWMHHLFVEDETLDGKDGASPLSKFAASNGLALRRADFHRCGGFDPGFPLAAGEDREFCVRWIAAGFYISVLEEAAIEHQFPESFGALTRQQWRYGRGAFHFQTRVRPSQRLRIRRARFYWRMMAEAPRRYGFGQGVQVGMLSWMSQGIVAGGYLWERMRREHMRRERMRRERMRRERMRRERMRRERLRPVESNPKATAIEEARAE